MQESLWRAIGGETGVSDYRALFISIALHTLDGIYASLNYDA